MLKPLRAKYGPTAVIDVHTSNLYGDAFHNNPLITNLIRYRAGDKNSAIHLATADHIPKHIKDSGYDLVLNPHPMYNNDKWSCSTHQELGENLIFAWVRALEDNGVPYTLPLESILVLTEAEIANVAKYREQARTMAIRKNVLMEVQGESGQSFWNGDWTDKVVRHLIRNNDTNVFISLRSFPANIAALQKQFPGHIHWAGSLSIRECAELFNFCQTFFSVSSGLSNACNTSWCKKDIRWIEVVNSLTCSSAAIRKDGKTFWHHNNVGDLINMLTESGL